MFTYKRAVSRVGGKTLQEDKIPELRAGLSYRHDTENGVWYFAQTFSYAAPWFQDNIDYRKAEGSISHLHDFGHRILGCFRSNYQYVPQKKIPVSDQMSAGAGLRFQLPYDMVLKTSYGIPLRRNKYTTSHGGDWNLELSFSPDFNKFFE